MLPRFATMSTPTTRAEFEERLNVLREQMRLGKIHLAHGLRIDSIFKVRILPNGRIDLLSVDESARLLANTIYQSLGDEFKDAVEAASAAAADDGEKSAGESP